MVRRCPKCEQWLGAGLPETASCPYCGVYFFKLGPQAVARPTVEETPADNLWARLGAPLPAMETWHFYGRILLLLALARWSYELIHMDYRDSTLMSSFMHAILLPIHEAGHVLMMPLGEFMMILGGSLFQLALPVGIALAFIWRNHDNFAAALGIWWTGTSLIDLAPYIYDALHPQLLLLSGTTGEDGPHDWIYLLESLHGLAYAQRLGAVVHETGCAVVIGAMLWAALVLAGQRRQLANQI